MSSNNDFAKKFATMTASGSDPEGLRHMFFSSCSVFVEKDDKLLLVEEVKYDVPDLVLDPPSTHTTWQDRSIIEAGVRAVRSETGYDAKITHLVGLYEIDIFERHYYHFVFIGELTQEEPTFDITDGDIQDVVWIEKEKADEIYPRMRSEALRVALRDYLAGKRFPLDILNHVGRTH